MQRLVFSLIRLLYLNRFMLITLLLVLLQEWPWPKLCIRFDMVLFTIVALTLACRYVWAIIELLLVSASISISVGLHNKVLKLMIVDHVLQGYATQIGSHVVEDLSLLNLAEFDLRHRILALIVPHYPLIRCLRILVSWVYYCSLIPLTWLIGIKHVFSIMLVLN